MLQSRGVIERVRRVLIDEGSVRWTLPELRDWFNDALREIAIVKSTAVSQAIILKLRPGTYQEIPADCFSVMRVPRNLRSDDAARLGGRSIRNVDRAMLDATDPNWHDERLNRKTKEVREVAFDVAAPRVFYVYPPNDGNGIVEAFVSRPPVGIPAPTGALDDIASYAAEIAIDEIYEGAIVDFILYRCYSKDSAHAGSAQRAAAHYSQFTNALGAKLANETMANPGVRGAA